MWLVASPLISVNKWAFKHADVEREEMGQGFGSKTHWKWTKTGRGRNTKQQRAISRQSDVMWVVRLLWRQMYAQQGHDRAPSLNLGVPPMLTAIPPFESLPPPSPVMSHTHCVWTHKAYVVLCLWTRISAPVYSLLTALFFENPSSHCGRQQNKANMTSLFPSFLPSSILSVFPFLSSTKWQAPPCSFYLCLAPSNRGELTKKEQEREDRFIGTDGG